MIPKAKELEILYATQRQRLERVAARRVGASDAPDVVQDVFTALWTRALDQLSLTPAYLVRATQFMSVSHFRAHKRREAKLSRLVEEQYAAPVAQPDRIYAAQQALRHLQSSLNALPHRTRLVFLLNRLHNCTYDEIAVELSISYSTVEREIARALMACKAIDDNE